MISKKIPRDDPGRYKNLALYIADAREEGEKLEAFWMLNCNAGETIEDLDVAIHEIEMTQAQSYRVKGSKTYHLITSRFSRMKACLKRHSGTLNSNFAEALGFAAYQRVVAATRTRIISISMLPTT